MRPSTDEPACKRVRVSNLLNCPVMIDGAPPYIDIDELAASDLLDQFRKRGMDDAIQRIIIKRTLDAENVGKLKRLIARFKAKIQAHHADVAAAQAALAAPGFDTNSADGSIVFTRYALTANRREAGV